MNFSLFYQKNQSTLVFFSKITPILVAKYWLNWSKNKFVVFFDKNRRVCWFFWSFSRKDFFLLLTRSWYRVLTFFSFFLLLTQSWYRVLTFFHFFLCWLEQNFFRLFLNIVLNLLLTIEIVYAPCANLYTPSVPKFELHF